MLMTLKQPYNRYCFDVPTEELVSLLDSREIQAPKEVYVWILSRCIEEECLWTGRRVHQHLRRTGQDRETFIGNHLIEMYGKCGSLEDALSVFEKIHARNLFSWKIMLSAYAHNGHMEEARRVFEMMPCRDVVAWNVMVTGFVRSGRVVHARKVFEKIPTKDAVSWNTMLAAYARKGEVSQARELFDQMPERNVSSWNAIITTYSENGDGKTALVLFSVMDLQGQKPNIITLVKALGACTELEQALVLHSSLRECGYDADVSVVNTLIDVFGRCKSVDNCHRCFNALPEHRRNVVTWSVMITACAGNGHVAEALQVFGMMNLFGLKPCKVVLMTIFDACASRSSEFFSAGIAIHHTLESSGFELDVSTGTALVDMYGKCGIVDEATSIFHRLQQKNVISWTAIIAAYARNGEGRVGVDYFRLMLQEGVDPNDVTILNVLAACSRAGMLETGFAIFFGVGDDHPGLEHSLDHYLCVIDLLARSGQVELAEELMKSISSHPDSVACGTLLAACQVHGKLKPGERVAGMALKNPAGTGSSYVTMSNLYSNFAAVGD